MTISTASIHPRCIFKMQRFLIFVEHGLHGMAGGTEFSAVGLAQEFPTQVGKDNTS